MFVGVAASAKKQPLLGSVEKTNKSELWNRLTHSTVELVLMETIIVGDPLYWIK